MTSGRSTLAWRPAGWVPPSRRDPHPAKSTPREDQRSGRRLPASSMMAPTTPTPTCCRGADRGGKSSDSASTLSTPPSTEPSAAPRRLQSLLIQGSGAPDVQVSLVAGGAHDPSPAVAEAREPAPERAGVRVTTVEVVDRSGTAPEVAGSKRTAPEQGLSGRPVKKARVRSKMLVP
jgi:hypothetical protein